MRLPTIRQMQFFLAVAENLSISRAAEACHVTQSTLSAALAELEDIVGESLFERDTRKLKLTQAGQDILAPCREIYERTKDMVRIAQKRREPLTGQLTLGVIPTIAPYLLPRLLTYLETHHPHLDLIIQEGTTQSLLNASLRGQLDVVLMAFPFDTPKMDNMTLWSEPFYLARKAEPDLLTGTRLDEIDMDSLLLLDDGHCLRDHVISACRLSPQSGARRTLGATSLQTLLHLVEHGYGTTILPEMAIRSDQLSFKIHIQFFEDHRPTRDIGLAWRHGDPRADEFRFLGTILLKHCQGKV